jgi:flagellar motor switch protein FliN/FliY
MNEDLASDLEPSRLPAERSAEPSDEIAVRRELEEGDRAGNGADGADALVGGAVAGRIEGNLELLRDVHLPVRVELGRGRMPLGDLLRLGQGSVVELESLAGDPLDISVGDQVIARGEVLVLDENYCIRITEVFRPEELRSET